jgi:tripartite-type tricarboxylate transporter receptor subunit TctC
MTSPLKSFQTRQRRTWVSALLASLCIGPLASLAFAQDAAWPTPGKPVRIVVPFPAGSGSDGLARTIARKLSEDTGGNFIVDNKPGAGTLIGAQDVARAANDGHTLLYTIVVTHTQNPHLYSKLPYDPFKDFTPITQVARSATVLVVNKDSPFNSVRDMVNFARSNPGKLNFASFSQGSTSHLNAEMLMMRSNTQMVHVPYKGTPDATRALIAGDVQFYFDGTATAVEGAKGGRFKLLAVAADKRLSVLPDLPTMTEAGIEGIDIVGWQGFFAPGNMSPALSKKISEAMSRALKSTEVSQMIINQGNEVSGAGPEEFARIVKRDHERWGAVIKRLNIKLD